MARVPDDELRPRVLRRPGRGGVRPRAHRDDGRALRLELFAHADRDAVVPREQHRGWRLRVHGGGIFAYGPPTLGLSRVGPPVEVRLTTPESGVLRAARSGRADERVCSMLLIDSFSAELLRERLQGHLVLPDEDGYDDARRAWNLAQDLRPAIVALPATPEDVRDIVAYAREQNLRVLVQGTGHNGTPVGDLSDTILVRTSAMRGVEIDRGARIARIQAGALWLRRHGARIRARPRAAGRFCAGRGRRRATAWAAGSAGWAAATASAANASSPSTS